MQSTLWPQPELPNRQVQSSATLAKRAMGSPLFLAVLLLAAFSLYNNWHYGLSPDETFSLDTSGRSLVQTLWRALYFELQPPLYFLALHFWLKLGNSLEWARLLSTLFALLSILAFALVSTALNIRRWSISLPILAAFSTPLIWASSVARGYALTVLLTTCLAWAFTRVWVRGTDHPYRDCALFVLIAYLALMNFYYTGFLIAGYFLAGLVSRKHTLALIASYAVLAGALAPWVPLILHQLREHPVFITGPAIQADSVLSYALALAHWTIQTLFYSFFVGVPKLLWVPGILPALVIIGASILLFRLIGHSPRLSRVELLFLIATAVPIAIMLYLSASGSTQVNQRHWIYLLPSVLIMLGLVVTNIERPRFRVLAGIGVTGFLAAGAMIYQAETVKCCGDHWRAAALHVANNERPDEAILLFSPWAEMPFRYYYSGQNNLRGVPVDDPWTIDYLVEIDAKKKATVTDVLRATVAVEEPFWMVRWDSSGDTAAGALLDRYIGENADVLDSRSFGGARAIRVMHIRLRGPSAETLPYNQN
jgi:hypothetical protein